MGDHTTGECQCWGCVQAWKAALDNVLDLPVLPEGYRFQVEPDGRPGRWLVTIEQRTGWRWWRDGWRHGETRKARVVHDDGKIETAGDIRLTAQTMARDLDRALELTR